MVQAEATMQTIKEVKSSCQIQKASLSIPIKQAYAKSSETENEVENKEVCRKHGRRQVVRTSFSFLAHSCSRRCDTSTMTAREEEARAPAQARGGEQQQQLAIEKTKVQSDDENEGARNDDQVDGILRAAEREVERERAKQRGGRSCRWSTLIPYSDAHSINIQLRARYPSSHRGCCLFVFARGREKERVTVIPSRGGGGGSHCIWNEPHARWRRRCSAMTIAITIFCRPVCLLFYFTYDYLRIFLRWYSTSEIHYVFIHVFQHLIAKLQLIRLKIFFIVLYCRILKIFKTAANCFSRMLSQRELINYIK